MRRKGALRVWRVSGGEEFAIFRAETIDEQAHGKLLSALCNNYILRTISRQSVFRREWE